MATQLVNPPISEVPPGENSELYECIDGEWKRKQSVGRRKHSAIEMALLTLLKPFQASQGGYVSHEWTILNGREKVIPDVTFSFPDYKEDRGYLVAPAWLVGDFVGGPAPIFPVQEMPRAIPPFGNAVLLDHRFRGRGRLRMSSGHGRRDPACG